MAFFAGIDGGQSSTVAVIGDGEGRVLGRGTGAPADEIAQNAQSTRLRDALRAAFDSALASARLPADTRCKRIVAGISGYEGRVYGRAPELPCDDLVLLHDAVIAHAGALGGEAGITIIAGTGCVAYAVNERGENATIGGWGYLFGDRGSGFWIAREALSRAMRAEDAAGSSAMMDIALRHFHAQTLHALARSFYAGEISRSDLAAFARVVIEHVHVNPTCDEVANDAAEELAMLAEHAMRRLAMQSAKVSLIGGLAKSALMREKVRVALHSIASAARIVEPRADPAGGALMLACRA